MRYHIRHETAYRYSEPVLVSLNQICLSPRDTTAQRVLRHTLVLTPAPHARTAWIDQFGNQQIQCSFSEPHMQLLIAAESVVSVTPSGDPVGANTLTWETAATAARAHADSDGLDALQYVFDSPRIRRSEPLREYASTSFPAGRPLVEGLADVVARMRRDFVYDKSATTIDTPIEEVLTHRRGVCQDFAQVLTGALRSLGLATRYVSGYLRTQPPPGQPRLLGADASHAWVSVYAAQFGWIDADPTNGLLVDDAHVTVAWGRDFQDVTPVKGVILGGGQQSIRVGVDVLPDDEPEHV